MNSNSKSNSRSRIYLKDILIPVITALVVVFANQMFFTPNKKTESEIELEMQLLKEQIPTLRRIIILTNKYDIYRWNLLYYKTEVKETYDESGELTDIHISQDFTKPDTLKFSIPSFVYIEELRNDFIANINEIRLNKATLDPEVYKHFQSVLEFLRLHPLPTTDNLSELNKSDWNNIEYHKEWDFLMAKLNSKVVNLLGGRI